MNYTSWWVLQSQTTTPLTFSINAHSSPRRPCFLKVWKVKASNAPCFSFPAILKLETEFGNISGMEHGTWTWILRFEWFRLPPPPKVMFQSNIAMHLSKLLILKQKCYPHSIFHMGTIGLPLGASPPSQKHVFPKHPHCVTQQCRARSAAGECIKAFSFLPGWEEPEAPATLREEVLLREWRWRHTRRYSLPHWSGMTSRGRVL